MAKEFWIFTEDFAAKIKGVFTEFFVQHLLLDEDKTTSFY